MRASSEVTYFQVWLHELEEFHKVAAKMSTRSDWFISTFVENEKQAWAIWITYVVCPNSIFILFPLMLTFMTYDEKMYEASKYKFCRRSIDKIKSLLSETFFHD